MKVTYHFNWKFWKPVECVGGKVYFGGYYRCEQPLWEAMEEFRRKNPDLKPGAYEVKPLVTLQTPSQYAIKRSMGIL